MPVDFDQTVRIISEQAGEVVQIYNRAMWVDAYSANREFVFSFAPMNHEPPFEILSECRLRWDINQIAMSMEPRPTDDEGNPVDESYIDIEVAIMLPPFSSLPKFADIRSLVVQALPQYNPPIFNLTQDYNIDAPSETVYHLKLDYLWTFEGESKILTARYADIFQDMGLLLRELYRARGGWSTVHYT